MPRLTPHNKFFVSGYSRTTIRRAAGAMDAGEETHDRLSDNTIVVLAASLTP
jgi:hypothetical protein